MGGVVLNHVAPKGISSAVVVRQMHGMLELIPRTEGMEAGLLSFEKRLPNSSDEAAVELGLLIEGLREKLLPSQAFR